MPTAQITKNNIFHSQLSADECAQWAVTAYASNFKPNYLTKKSLSKPFRKKFRSKSHPFHVALLRPRFHAVSVQKVCLDCAKFVCWTNIHFFPCSVYSTLHCFLNGCPVYFCRGHGRGFIAVFIMSRVWPALFRLSALLVSVTVWKIYYIFNCCGNSALWTVSFDNVCVSLQDILRDHSVTFTYVFRI